MPSALRRSDHNQSVTTWTLAIDECTVVSLCSASCCRALSSTVASAPASLLAEPAGASAAGADAAGLRPSLSLALAFFLSVFAFLLGLASSFLPRCLLLSSLLEEGGAVGGAGAACAGSLL